jgi:drug/metabolite transporter (DMT)-like permease
MPWIADLVLLAALWGGSFMLMRWGALEFGPIGTAFLRVALAAVLLFAVLAARRQVHVLKKHAGPALLVGIFNSALPFALFSYAVLSISTGLSSILNATVPIWGAIVAAVWLGDRLALSRIAGLALGVVGVAVLSWGKVSAPVSASSSGAGWAILACLAATFCYGLSASYAKRYLSGVAPLATATGSQIGATLGLALPAGFLMPSLTGPTAPGLRAWIAIALVAALCTALAYILYFRLIERAGPQRALTVTFLVPVFGVAYGALLLDERLDPSAWGGAALILAGTALAVGAVKWPLRQREAALTRE